MYGELGELYAGGLNLCLERVWFHLVLPKTKSCETEKSETMAVALSGLPCVSTFDTVGEPETLSQRWTLWKDAYKLYVAAVSNKA